MFWEATAVTHRGRRRGRNEDAFLLRSEAGVFAVADGMGGHAAGDIASRLAVDVFGQTFAAARSDGAPTVPAHEAVIAAIEAANLAVFNRGTGDAELDGMGTTFTAVALLPLDRGCIIGHVGDSRVYLLRRGTTSPESTSTRSRGSAQSIPESERQGSASDRSQVESDQPGHEPRRRTDDPRQPGFDPDRQTHESSEAGIESDQPGLRSDGSADLPDESLPEPWRAALEPAGPTLTQLTTDHTLVQHEVDAGTLTRAQARTHPHANVLTRALGTQEDVPIDLVQTDLRPDDLLLICSDGLTAMLDDIDLETLLTREAPLVEQARQLVDAANMRGGVDNITALLIRVGDSSPPGGPPTCSRPA